ncbi:MATE family efflux transporter [Vibrio ostreicida]|uniref:Multidrug resistance protein NorM n=1 Tax=Vibrio ostreicida TaxID=526588 RepID=A0ABT8BSM5_9VIBR|nr:MATE family efflux transporter [Vibrio ostreicida]MDN3609948.1 MATE family efflux transporter [Vibrio ostreicida]NPD10376.1 MATE family efflux transporter [Vibrio ostreicida]
MYQYKSESKKLISLATPVFIASIAQTGMGVVDTIMAGDVSATDMASVSIAASIWLPAILFGIGLLMALVPIVAQLNGSGRQVKIPFEIHQGAALALIITVPTIVVLLQTKTILGLMEVEPLMAQKTMGYMNAVMFAVPAFLLFQVLRSLTDGLSLTKPAMIIGFIGLLLNIPLNWIFVFGKFGAPALGGVGCGVATAIVYWLMFLMLLAYVTTSKRLSHINLFERFHKPKVAPLIRLFGLGFPAAAAMFFEVTLFAVVALLVAPFGPLVVAAHQVAMNFSSMIFMLPMSISVATSIRVGQRLGEKNTQKAEIASKVALLFAVILSLITAFSTFMLREHIALLYTQNRAVVELAMQLLVFAAIYQVTDAIQVVAAGALRGYKDMKAIFNRTLVAYWLLGFPTGYILAMTDWLVEPMGAKGFWIGYIVGLSSAALMLGSRLVWIYKQPKETLLLFAEK